MTRYVIDASVAVEYLLKTPVGLALADLIERAALITPELLDAEVLSALRGAVLGGHLEEGRALEALDNLTAWPLERIPNRTLARLAWGASPQRPRRRRLLHRRRLHLRRNLAHCRRQALENAATGYRNPAHSDGVAQR